MKTTNGLGHILLRDVKDKSLYFISFQNNVTLQVRENNFKKIFVHEGRKWFVLKPSGTQIHLKVFKTLQKSFNYEYNLDIGTKIICLEYENKELKNKQEVYDCCAISDLSVSFISYMLCGILLTFVFKVYLKY
jgi:hypothetical protein